ncbi:MAG: hypothetical protein ACJ74O_05230 [Frankiaceae bacterium]
MDEQDPPNDGLAQVADLRCLLVRSRDVLVGVDCFRLWPSGVQFALTVRLRQEQPPVALPELVVDPADADLIPSARLLRFAVTCADGIRREPESRATRTGLRQTGGSGSGFGLAESGGACFGFDFWLTPRPSGEVTFEVECADIGVERSTASVKLPERIPEPVTFLAT